MHALTQESAKQNFTSITVLRSQRQRFRDISGQRSTALYRAESFEKLKKEQRQLNTDIGNELGNSVADY